MTDKEIRDEAMRRVMWQVGSTNNGVTRYIADAVANQVVRDERGSYGWIPVEEQLPKTDDGYVHIMVSMDDGFVCTTDYTDRDGFELWADSGEVIAWMPLPEPYRPDALLEAGAEAGQYADAPTLQSAT